MYAPPRVLVQRIAHYRIVERIGRGGMGEVYRAFDERLDRQVALKLLPIGLGMAAAELQRAEARLLREARAASALNHPSIVTLFDVGTWRGQLYLVMELVEGESFTVLAQRGVTASEALRLVAAVADALAVAHERGILHRDVKSDNLMRRTDGRATVVDFGVAKLYRRDGAAGGAGDPALAPTEAAAEETLADPEATADDPALAAAGAARVSSQPPGAAAPGASPLPDKGPTLRTEGRIGTPAYMSPEQLRGEPADAQTEVYALGVVLYELLAGRRPERDLLGVLTPPGKVTPGRRIPRAAAAVAMRALERDRRARFADMTSFAAAARRAMPTRRTTVVVLASGGAGLAALSVVALVAAIDGRRGTEPAAGASDAASHGTSAAASVANGATSSASTSAAAASPPFVIRSTFSLTASVPGCEEYPAFTPDGAKVIFDAPFENSEQIYVVDIATKAIQKLTDDTDVNYLGSVSPDGRHLLYLHYDSGAAQARLAPWRGADTAVSGARALGAVGSMVIWTPEGDVLGTDDRDDPVVWRAANDFAAPERARFAYPYGARVTSISPLPQGGAYAVFEQADSRKIWLQGFGRDGSTGPLEYLPYVGGDMRPLLAPLGAAVYVSRPSESAPELVRAALDPEERSVVSRSLAPNRGMAFDRSGSRFAYAECRSVQYIARVQRDRPPEPLAASPPRPRASGDDYPLRVGARHILWRAVVGGEARLVVRDFASGGDERPIGAADAITPAASADGTLVAYMVPGKGLEVVELATGTTRSLTDERGDAEPAFSRDGRTVVFTRLRDRERWLYALPATGGEAHALAGPDASDATLSPVNDRVVFVHHGANGDTLLATDLRGAQPERFAALPLVPQRKRLELQSPHFSADGRTLLVVEDRKRIVEIDVSAPDTRRLLQRLEHGAMFLDADYAPDGAGAIASILEFQGDLFLAEGTFR